MIITYELGNALYVNVTNRCTNRCSFCIRNTAQGVGTGVDLWLEREPTVREVIDDIERRDLSKYKEIVFCGYGEPMVRAYDIIEICKSIKEKFNIPIRINTNGHANLIHGEDITPMLKGLVDCISISLNAKNAAEYQEICGSDYGEQAYHGMLDFAAKCKGYIPQVILTVVDVMPKEDIEACERIAKDIGVEFRVRHYSA
ncbi:MAG: molybdenum cofactor biosynthesis protein [Clostridia bacterium]|jgi:radical SAM enzyme (TIGR04100 family)|uniref:TIGR04100 family radical SAM protein n=1 Tax=Petroclostridium xylanilyticum TaxID=1792311 RepID=UPI000B992A78|nr:TIGR04100 family radical SAM protein [Petroclostridium xylanilyticum]MBZ4646115.1 molybdenum cofactor biosynthesis protein [Clostridia bacterium]